MFITSVLLLLASFLPMQNREDIDQARFTAYDYLDQGQIDSAFIVMDKAISAAEKIDYAYGIAKSIFVKSYLHRINNQLGKSFELNLKALRILELSNDQRSPKTLAEIYNNTGEILIHHFKYQEAIKHFEYGLKIAIDNQLDEKVQNLYYNRGYALWEAKEFLKSTEDFNSSLEMAMKLGDEWMYVSSHNMLGRVALDQEEFENARTHFFEIINHTFIDESKEKYTAMAYSNVGKTYFLEGKIQSAESAYTKALNNFSLIEEPIQLFNTQLALVELYISVNDFSKAWHYGNLTMDNYPNTILSPENYRLFNLLTTIAFERNEYQKARQFHQKYVEENDAFIEAQKETLQLSEQYKMEMLTANFFKDIEKQEQMAQLNQIIYLLLGLGLISFVFFRAKKYLLKRSLEQAFREVTQKKNLYL